MISDKDAMLVTNAWGAGKHALVSLSPPPKAAWPFTTDTHLPVQGWHQPDFSCFIAKMLSLTVPQYLENAVQQDLKEKMVFISRPPQEGKTSLAKAFLIAKRLDIPHLYQISLEGSEDILDGKVRIMPAGRFLAALP